MEIIGENKFNTFFIFIFLTTTTTVLAQCPSSFYSLSMFAPGIPGCIYFSQDKTQLVSWGVGQKMCKQMDPRANLPFFADTSQMSQFQGMSGMLAMQVGKATVWLGGYKSRSKDTWLFADGTTMMTNATGGWQKGTPNTTTTESLRCLGYSIGGTDTGWRDFPCSSNFSVGCYIGQPNQKLNVTSNINSVSSVLSTTPPVCPSDWSSSGSYCYKMASTTDTMLMNFTSALSACQQLDPRATLPQFYYSSIYDTFINFVELHRPSTDHQYILLGAKKVSGVYTNPDTIMNFTNWFATQPAGDECVFTSDFLGYGWNTTSCSMNGYAICQLNATADLPTTTGPATTSTSTIGTTTMTQNFTGSTASTAYQSPYTGSTTTTTAPTTVSTLTSTTTTTTTSTPATTTTKQAQSNDVQSQATVGTTNNMFTATTTTPAAPKAATSVIVPYSWTWSPPMWFLVVLGLLVALPVIFWITAICYRECRDRKEKTPEHPQIVQSQQPILIEQPKQQKVYERQPHDMYGQHQPDMYGPQHMYGQQQLPYVEAPYDHRVSMNRM